VGETVADAEREFFQGKHEGKSNDNRSQNSELGREESGVRNQEPEGEVVTGMGIRMKLLKAGELSGRSSTARSKLEGNWTMALYSPKKSGGFSGWRY
jgi:hypothetical protein